MRILLAACSAFALTVGFAHAERIEYEYDAHGRLVKVERCGTGNVCDGVASDDTTTDYTYDDADNRTEKKVTVDPPP